MKKVIGLLILISLSLSTLSYAQKAGDMISGNVSDEYGPLMQANVVEMDAANLPRLSYGDVMGNNRFSDRWIEDGSYLRLKTLHLSYHRSIHNQVLLL